MDIKSIAIYLPQFHPIPENDECWGKGFTEWTNVVKTQPKFVNHYQPHLPADLGFYDLRLKESRLVQIELAKKYGIHGFCYYHYWFNGKRVLNEPIDRMISNKDEDFPFMVCWANENWTRRWDGKESEILIAQIYSEEDDIAHINFLLDNFLHDPRYIRVNGKPLVAIYKPNSLPNAADTIRLWRREAMKRNVELSLVYFQSTGNYFLPESLDFDAGIEFPPFGQFEKYNIKPKISFLSKILNRFGIYRHDILNRIYDYNDLVDVSIDLFSNNYPNVYPGITPMWDNSSRRKVGALIYINSSPDSYFRWLKHIIISYESRKIDGPNFIFINAWNEWAEGNHLEPCSKWKLTYLEATKQALKYGNTI